MIIFFPIFIFCIMLVFLYFMILAMAYFVGIAGIGIFYLGKGILIGCGKIKKSNDEVPFRQRISALGIYLKKRAQTVINYFDNKPVSKGKIGER